MQLFYSCSNKSRILSIKTTFVSSKTKNNYLSFGAYIYLRKKPNCYIDCSLRSQKLRVCKDCNSSSDVDMRPGNILVLMIVTSVVLSIPLFRDIIMQENSAIKSGVLFYTL